MKPWSPAHNGGRTAPKRPWFVARRPCWSPEDYHNGPSGNLVRFASMEAAQRRADALNAAEVTS